MDFSGVDRALASLSRRQPPLPNEVLDLSNRLLELFVTLSSSSSDHIDLYENEEYAKGILRLMDLGSSSSSASVSSSSSNVEESSSFVRWEPLAVGLRLVVDYLEKKTNALPKVVLPVGKVGQGEEAEEEDDDNDEEDEGTGLGTGGGGVYAEGPRIPKIAGTTTSAAGVDPTTKDKKSSSPPPSANSPVFEIMLTLPTIIDDNVEHSEPRVRSLVAQTVGAYARYATSLLNWLGCGRRHRGKNDDDANDESRSAANDEEEWKMLEEAIHKAQVGRRSIHSAILISLKKHLEMKEPVREEGKNNNQSKASDGALDDTTGWRALETNLHGLASYVDGCVGGRAGTTGYVGGSYIAEEMSLFQAASSPSLNDVSWFLSGLQHCCVVHVNRHVRAASAAVLGVLVKACMRSRDASHHDLLVEVDSPFRLVLKESLRATLADNWSQVRMAGSVLCRRLVGALIKIHARGGVDDDDDEEEDVTVFETALGDLVPMLLPRMCLNRFYLAQGVKLYSQDTWKLVFGTVQGHSPDEEGLHSSEEMKGGGGLGAVARNAASVCRYYSKMCDADNHAVREAACQGVAELAQKVGKHPMYAEHLSPHVTMLLQALLMCFHDESWPVRDEACLACGTFCIAYADECLPELPTIFERWTEQLTDQIWSVREDAAVALGDAITAYGPEMLEKVLAIIRKSIPAAKDQPSMSRDEFKKLQNDAAAHTGNQLYSCGSLAPKLRKGGAGRIGCMTCFIDRPRSPWEATDGCIYLLRELCVRFANGDSTEREDVIMSDNILLPLMRELADVCRLSHYPQSDDLRTTLWKQLPPIAEALGKRRFKGLYLDMFIDLLAKNLDDSTGSGTTQLSIHAAGQCAEELASQIGVGIFRGRLEDIGGQYAFDRVMEERKREQQMTAFNGRTMVH